MKNTYVVIEREDERVVLELLRPLKDTEVELQRIKADTWLEAREKVNESNLYHNPGYGYVRGYTEGEVHGHP